MTSPFLYVRLFDFAKFNASVILQEMEIDKLIHDYILIGNGFVRGNKNFMFIMFIFYSSLLSCLCFNEKWTALCTQCTMPRLLPPQPEDTIVYFN